MTRPTKRIHLVCNAHLDPVWLWTWEEGVTEAIATFRTAAEFCEEHEGFVFNHNESLLYRWIQRHDPPLLERIQKLVAAGRWHISGGAYLQPDVNHPSGESHIRQFLYGLDFFEKVFSARPRVAYNFDPFGHPEGFPQILLGCGMTGYIFCRPEFGNYQLPRGAFRWTDRDGSAVVTRRSDDHYLTRPGRGGVEKAWDLGTKVRKYAEHYKDEPVSLLLWGIGNHGGGPSRKDWEHLDGLRRDLPDVELVHSTPERFFEELQSAAGESLPTRRGEIEESFVGCYTSMSRVKRAHRQAEAQLLAFERLASLAWWHDGADYPQEAIDDLWRDVLFAQFHDILPGSCIPQAEQDAVNALGGVIDRLRRMRLATLLQLLRGERRAEDGDAPVFLLNTHPHRVKRVVEFEFYTGHHPPESPDIVVRRDGKTLEHQLLRPAHNLSDRMIMRAAVELDAAPFEIVRLDVSFVASSKSEAEAPVKPTADQLTLQAGGRTIRISPETGLIDAIELDGQAGSLVEAGAFCPVVFNDLDHAWTAGDPSGVEKVDDIAIKAPAWKAPIASFRLATRAEMHQLSPLPMNKWLHGDQPKVGEPLQVVASGPVRTIIEAIFVCGPSACFRQYHFDHPTGRLEIRDRYFINHRDKLFKVEVPLGFAPQASESESLFSVASRLPTSDHQEHHNQRWLAVTREDGAALGVLNDGSFAHSLTDRTLALDIVRTPAYASFGMRPDDPYLAHRFTPRQDQGEHLLSFVIEPQAQFDDLELTRQAAELNAPVSHVSYFPSGLETHQRSRLPQLAGGALQVQPAHVEVTALKKAHRSEELVVRLRETRGEATRAQLTLNGETFDELELKPFSVQTVMLQPGKTVVRPTNLVEGL